MTQPDLLEIARGVAAMARPGEQVEAYVLRSRDTDVQVFDGEVESLAVAEVDGVGVRLLLDHRQGYAWAGSLDPEVVAETVAEARDNAGFGTQDEALGLPEPADVEAAIAPDLDLWRDALLAIPDGGEGRARARGGSRDPARGSAGTRRRVRVATATVRSEVAVASSLGVEASARRTVCSVASFAMAGEGDETQTGYGFSVGPDGQRPRRRDGRA